MDIYDGNHPIVLNTQRMVFFLRKVLAQKHQQLEQRDDPLIFVPVTKRINENIKRFSDYYYYYYY